MKLTMRSYQSEADFWSVRNFLRQVFMDNDRHMYSWPLARWDYWRWHGIMNLGDGHLETDVSLWETAEQKIVALLNTEGAGQAFLQIHPAYKTPALEEQMISHAEDRLCSTSQTGGHAITIWSDSKDEMRASILEKQGYVPVQEWAEHQWLRNLELPIPDKPLPEGYSIRSLGDESELPSRSWASWRAFHPNEPDEKYEHGYLWYRNIQKAPLYRRDLDLIATAPNGEVAAFTTIWYDDVTRSGYFEPVGTMPEHQRQGLGSALLCEGMRRLKESGATLAMTIGGTLHANALYRSVLGPEYDLSVPWEKKWIA
jgi:mycothiol synthase